jgi:hypothetical protein
MKRHSILILMAAFLLVVPFSGYAEQWGDLFEQKGLNGGVNWSRQLIQAKGIGAPPESMMGKPQARPMALRAAQLDAYRNLLEVTKGVQITSATTVKNYVVENDVIMSKIEGMIKGAQIVKQEYMSDGSVEVTMQMSLTGGFAQLVLPQDIKPIEPVRQLPSVETPTPAAPEVLPVTPPEPLAPGATPTPTPASGVFTGMVVDARGLNARPAMSPKITDENGQEVYGSAFVSREYAVQQGMSGYAKDITAAQSNQRVTNNPLTVKGLKTEGPGRADIVVSNADAAKLRSASENLSFLKKCRVMIVVD